MAAKARFLCTLMLACVLGLAVLTSGCGSDEVTDPQGNTQPEDPDPEPNPDGVLLEGDPTDPAIEAVVVLPPSPAEEADVEDDLLLTRLSAYLDPDATVAQVNTALSDAGATIVAMHTGLPAVTLKVPRAADQAAAEQLAAALEATEAFALVYPAWQPSTLAKRGQRSATKAEVFLPPDHVLLQQFSAAWRGLEAARATNHLVTVLVPDFYTEPVAHTFIPSQIFVGDGDYGPANHGTHVCGTIGATPTENFAGVHGDSDLIVIASMPAGGMSFDDIMYAMVNEFPASGSFVLSTSLGINDHDFSGLPKLRRAMMAAIWRSLTFEDSDRFFHATSAGNNGQIAGDAGETRYNSPFTTSNSYADLRDLAAEDETATAAQLASFNGLMAILPGVDFAPDNVIAVGSSDYEGNKSDFSNRGADLRAIGEDIPAPCVVPGGGCDGNMAELSGTSMATPQVAGLAAYMMNLRPGLAVSAIRELIQLSYDTDGAGLLAVYPAVLGTDASLASAAFRKAMLDVTDSSGQAHTSDGRFDEHDLELFLEELEDFDDHNEGVDFSPFDLNGNFKTRMYDAYYFDLDVNNPPAWGEVTQTIEGETFTYDETSLSDLEILCYYAYSSLYEGSEEIRGQLMPEPCGVERGIVVVDEEEGRYLWSAAGASVCGHAPNTTSAETVDPFEVDLFNDFSCVDGIASGHIAYVDSLYTDDDGNITTVAGSGSGFGSATRNEGEDIYYVRGSGAASMELEFEVIGRTAQIVIDATADPFAIGPQARAHFEIEIDGDNEIEHEWHVEYPGNGGAANGEPEKYRLEAELPPGEYYLDVNASAWTNPLEEHAGQGTSASVSFIYRVRFSQE